MAGWLAKTTQLLRPRHTSEPPPPYDLDCAAAIICGECGSRLFRRSLVLGAAIRGSFFPLTSIPGRKSKRRRSSRPPCAPWSTPRRALKASQAVQAPSTHASGSKPAQAAGGPVRPGTAAGAGAGAAVRDEAKSAAADSVIVPARGPLVSRFTLIVLAIAGVVTATGYFVWQSRLNDRTGLIARPSRSGGEGLARATCPRRPTSTAWPPGPSTGSTVKTPSLRHSTEGQGAGRDRQPLGRFPL